jgi:hypothetical protein
MPNFAERLLARITDRTRAAAIMGDLLELAQTRGRFWFAASYLRTLISLAWRTPIAFLAGWAAFQLATSAIEFCILHTPVAWQTAMRSGPFASMGPLVATVPLALWFMLPFGLIRYGRRDKFVQLAGASALLASVAFLDPRLLSPIPAIAVATVTVALLAIPAWRRAVVVLLSTVAAGSAAAVAILFGAGLASHYLAEQLHPGRLIYKSQPPWAAVDLAALLVLAVLCSSLHDRLLAPRHSGGTHAEPA